MNKAKKKSTRTVSGDAAVVTAHRLAKGWSVETLAAEAGRSESAIKNIEDGGNAYITTWHDVAEALNLDIQTLIMPKGTEIKGFGTPAEPPTKRGVYTIRVQLPNALFDKVPEVRKWVEMLTAATGAEAMIEIVDHFEGSTNVCVSMAVRDFRIMCELFLSGELTERAPELQIVAIFASDLRDPNAFLSSLGNNLHPEIDDAALRAKSAQRHKRK